MTYYEALRIPFCVLSVILAGCTSMSGIGGTSEFNCTAPVGVPCRSMAAIDHAIQTGQLAAQATPRSPQAQSPMDAPVRSMHAPARHLPSSAVVSEGEDTLGAIRSEPTVIRIWIAPYEDSDGDLHEASRVYLQIDSGRWLIEHNRQRIRSEFAPSTRVPKVTQAAARPSLPPAEDATRSAQHAVNLAPTAEEVE